VPFVVATETTGANERMIAAGVGLSTASNTRRAAREAAERAVVSLPDRSADFAIAFATAEHAGDLPDLLEAVTGALGSPYVAGCSASGVIAEAREIETGPAIGVLAVRSDAVRGTPFLFQDAGDGGLTAGIHAGQRLLSSRDTNDLVLVWPDPYAVRPDRLLQGLDTTLGPVPVAGGAASSALPGASTFQFSGSQASSGCVSGIRLGGAFRHHVALTQGCRPLGAPMRVTRAHENLVLEVEGRPAYEALREAAPPEFFDDPEATLQYLTIALLPEPGDTVLRPGEYLVRNILSVDADTGVIEVAADVEEGQSILFALREPAAAGIDVMRMAERVAACEPAGGFKFGLYFNCLARGSSLYGREGVDSAALSRHLPGVPILGFSCNAEIAPLRGMNALLTYTGVLVLVSD
jgi:small ligand-binding sensory domain FIST